MIKKLVGFDFDTTLVETVAPEEGRAIWELKTGTEWPYRGWFGRAESLNLEVFEMPINDFTYPLYLKYRKDPEAYCFLATGRIVKLKKEVMRVLDHHNFQFDDVFLNPHSNTFTFKMELFDKIIANNPQAEEFILIDDRQTHLHGINQPGGELGFIKWAKRKDIKVTIYDALHKVELFKNY